MWKITAGSNRVHGPTPNRTASDGETLWFVRDLEPGQSIAYTDIERWATWCGQRTGYQVEDVDPGDVPAEYTAAVAVMKAQIVKPPAVSLDAATNNYPTLDEVQG